MKTKKGVALLSIITLVTLAVVLTGGNFIPEKSPEHLHLMKTAKTEGTVRVIIKIDVPNIYRLTEASREYKTGIEDAGHIQAAYNADLDLELAVSAAADGILHKLNKSSYEINHKYTTLPYLALTVSPAALSILQQSPEVLTLVEDVPRPLPQTWKDQELAELDRPQINASRKIIGAEDAWSLGFTGKGWYVAILDSGIYPGHEFFTGKNIVEQCYSTLRDCPNGKSSMAGPGSAAHIMNGESHGTHVAGIATGNNKDNMYGVAKDANIMAVQVFSYIASWDDIGSYNSDQISGLEFVYKNRNNYKIASVNMSLGGGQYSGTCDTGYWDALQKDAIDNLRAVGIATVVASGNDGFCGSINAPACISSAIAVSATDKSDKHWRYGNWHANMIDFFAPGVSISSSTTKSKTSYESWNGTSMATPHVAGAFALLKQFNKNISVGKALQVLKGEGLSVSSRCQSGKSDPRIDIGASIMSLLSIAPPQNFSGNRQINRSLLQDEYINILTWDPNPVNIQNNQNIVMYKIYTVEDSSLVLLVEVDGSTFEYWHRMTAKDAVYEYAVKSVNAKGDESIPAYVTVQ